MFLFAFYPKRSLEWDEESGAEGLLFLASSQDKWGWHYKTGIKMKENVYRRLLVWSIDSLSFGSCCLQAGFQAWKGNPRLLLLLNISLLLFHCSRTLSFFKQDVYQILIAIRYSEPRREARLSKNGIFISSISLWRNWYFLRLSARCITSIIVSHVLLFLELKWFSGQCILIDQLL